MRKFVKTAVTAAAICVPFSAALASDSDGGYTIYGIGVNPCHEFLTATGGDRVDYVNWLMGFLSASNAIFSVTNNITPGTSNANKFLSIVWKQCRAYHDTRISDAALTIATRLHDRLIANPTQNPYEGYE